MAFQSVNKEKEEEQKQETGQAGQNNPYLDKEQKKFYANQWKEQLFLQINCGMQRQIRIGTATYDNKTISDDDEVVLNNYWTLLQKVIQLNEIKIQELATNEKEIDIPKLKEQLDKLNKSVQDVERDYFCECAKRFYEIPKDVALANRELLSPYIAGRNYLRDLRVIGNTYNSIKSNDPVSPAMLKKLVQIITDRHYS